MHWIFLREGQNARRIHDTRCFESPTIARRFKEVMELLLLRILTKASMERNFLRERKAQKLFQSCLQRKTQKF